MKAIVITPPAKVFEGPYKKIFLAGSIEMGKAEDWQKKIIDAVQDSERIIFNPRREKWDASWEQSIDNPKFKEQVEWELNALECSDMIIMNLVPETMSPISLLEFGLFARSGKLVVYCPDGFWRKGTQALLLREMSSSQLSIRFLTKLLTRWRLSLKMLSQS